MAIRLKLVPNRQLEIGITYFIASWPSGSGVFLNKTQKY